MAQSNNMNITSNGTTTYSLISPAVVPASGNLYAGWESNGNYTNTLFYTQGGADNMWAVNHSFASGPSSFGCGGSCTWPNGYYVGIKGSAPTVYVTYKWDGSVLSTSPTVIVTNSTGGFNSTTFTVPYSVTGLHTFNASDSSGLFATQLFTVTTSPPTSNFPYVTTLHYTSLTNSTVTLAWSTPNMTTYVFHGYQIRYTTPNGTPNTVLVNNTSSPVTSYLITGLSSGTQYSFQIGTWANSTNFFSLANILDITSLTNTPPNLTPGNLNLNVGTNPLHVGYQFFLQNTNATKKDLFVSFPTTYNTTCNLDYQFANTNHSYYNLATVANGTGRVKADFQFFNIGNEIITTVCRDINTNDTGHYVITNSIDTIPLVQQVHNFDNGVYGTSGQFSGIDLIELLVIIISMIALNMVNETLGAIIMVFVLGGLAFFHIGSLPVIIFGAIAVVLLLIVGTTKKLGYTP